MSARQPSIHRRADLLARGLTDSEVRVLVRRGALVRLCTGAYAVNDELAELSDEGRYAVRVRAVAGRSDGLVVSHTSAAVLYELPLMSFDTSRVELTRPGRGGHRSTPDRVVHAGEIPTDQIVRIGGLTVTSPARTVVDVARTRAGALPVALADAALQRGLVSPDELVGTLARAAHQRGVPAAWRGLGRVDGRAESPGETLTRLLLLDQGLTGIELQIEVRDVRGVLVGRADLECPEHGVLIEFDGRVKYQGLLRPGQSVADAVLAEKAREERLSELGWLVLRVTWGDLARPSVLAQRVRTACAARHRLVLAGGLRGSATPRSPLGLGRSGPLRH